MGYDVVVGYDGSDASRAAVVWATERARSRGRLHVVYSRPRGKGVDEQAVLATLHIHAGHVLSELDWEFQLLEGRPAQVLLAAARRFDADEIVVGLSSGGRSPSGHDSVSCDLIRAADRPVTVVPACVPGHAAAGLLRPTTEQVRR